jgi:hypothetical protein
MRRSVLPLALCALAALAFSPVAAMRFPDDEKRDIDTWVLSNDLDEVGNPRGTMYTGGAPLFDERSGRRVDRYEYIVRAHPDRPWKTQTLGDAEPPDAEPLFDDVVFLHDADDEKKKAGGRFPSRWGPEPAAQTRDYRELPGGYGFGSSTLARWIEQNMAKDAAAPAAAPAPDDLRRR